jgi:hypothetical protein
MPNLDDFLSRIQTDHTFYSHFRQNPEEALKAYELCGEERALIESPEQLWERPGQLDSHWKTSCNCVLLETGEPGFNICTALAGPEVQNTISEICKADANNDRFRSVLVLVE